jgi:cysteine desulfuration protein SufE
MSELPPVLREIVEEFQSFSDPQDYFEELIAYGEDLDELPREQRTEANRVPGCVSNVHIEAETRDGKIYFRGCSDSHLVRGLVAILVKGLSNIPPEDVVRVEPDFLHEAGLLKSLTPSRANASYNIFEMMKRRAAEAAA